MAVDNNPYDDFSSVIGALQAQESATDQARKDLLRINQEYLYSGRFSRDSTVYSEIPGDSKPVVTESHYDAPQDAIAAARAVANIERSDYAVPQSTFASKTYETVVLTNSAPSVEQEAPAVSAAGLYSMIKRPSHPESSDQKYGFEEDLTSAIQATKSGATTDESRPLPTEPEDEIMF